MAKKQYFAEYKVDDVDAVLADAFQRHSTMMDFMQDRLFNIAAEIEVDVEAGATILQNWLLRFSTADGDKLAFSSDARQIYKYMTDIFPVKYTGKLKTGEWKIVPDKDRVKGFRFGDALKKMQAVRWDKYMQQKETNKAFEADKTLAKGIALIKSVITAHDKGELQDDDPAFVRARAIAKAF